MCVVSARGADRAGRARDERHHRELRFSVSLRLMMNAALVTMIAKDARRKLTTRIAVYARGIDEEVAGDILR